MKVKMFDTLRKRARNTYMWRMILCIAGTAIILAVTKGAVFELAGSMKGMDITAGPETYEGKAVMLDAEFFVSDYVEHTTTTVRESGSRSTSTDGSSYIAFQSVYNDGDEYSTLYFYSIYMRKSKEDMLYDKIDETWNFLMDESGKTSPPAPVRAMGTWSKMEPAMESYYMDTIREIGIEESEYDKIYLYTLDTGHLGGLNVYLFWGLMGVAILLTFWALTSLIGFFRRTYEKEIHKYLKKNTSCSPGEIEADFTTAHPVGKDIWIGRKWTIYMSGAKARILRNQDLVWGYYFEQTGRGYVSQMKLFTVKKGMICISLSEALTREALLHYADEQPQMVVGYSEELAQLYYRNFPAFLDLKYNPAIKEAPEGTFLNI